MRTIGVALAVLIAAMWLTGCSKDSAVTPAAQMTDQQVLQKQVATVDSIAQFLSSDEATIDDGGMQNPDYEGFMKEAGWSGGRDAFWSIDSLTPIRWGRHIFWDQVQRVYTVVMDGDSAATVFVTKTLPGEFRVGYGTRTADTVIIDTVVRKPFVETVKRNVRFRRIAHDEDRERNWAPVAITLVRGLTDSNSFAISSLELDDATSHLDTTVTDPLGTWFRLGIAHGSVPRLTAGDSVIVRVTLTSADDSAEVVVFRHGVDGGGMFHRRVRMNLVSTTGGPGSYTRVYEKRFSPRLPMDMRAARFNAVVDVLPRGTIAVPGQPFRNEFWGMPYLVTH